MNRHLIATIAVVCFLQSPHLSVGQGTNTEAEKPAVVRLTSYSPSHLSIVHANEVKPSVTFEIKNHNGVKFGTLRYKVKLTLRKWDPDKVVTEIMVQGGKEIPVTSLGDYVPYTSYSVEASLGDGDSVSLTAGGSGLSKGQYQMSAVLVAVVPNEKGTTEGQMGSDVRAIWNAQTRHFEVIDTKMKPIRNPEPKDVNSFWHDVGN